MKYYSTKRPIIHVQKLTKKYILSSNVRGAFVSRVWTWIGLLEPPSPSIISLLSPLWEAWSIRKRPSTLTPYSSWLWLAVSGVGRTSWHRQGTNDSLYITPPYSYMTFTMSTTQCLSESIVAKNGASVGYGCPRYLKKWLDRSSAWAWW